MISSKRTIKGTAKHWRCTYIQIQTYTQNILLKLSEKNNKSNININISIMKRTNATALKFFTSIYDKENEMKWNVMKNQAGKPLKNSINCHLNLINYWYECEHNRHSPPNCKSEKLQIEIEKMSKNKNQQGNWNKGKSTISFEMPTKNTHILLAYKHNTRISGIHSHKHTQNWMEKLNKNKKNIKQLRLHFIWKKLFILLLIFIKILNQLLLTRLNSLQIL